MGRTIAARTATASWDNGIYQADSRELGAPAVTADMLPAYCGPLTDMGRDQRCARAARIDMLHSHYASLSGERVRQPRLRSDWKARNLAGWIAFAERELIHMLSWALPACTCGEHAFTVEVRDREQALPACTC